MLLKNSLEQLKVFALEQTKLLMYQPVPQQIMQRSDINVE